MCGYTDGPKLVMQQDLTSKSTSEWLKKKKMSQSLQLAVARTYESCT